VTLATSRCFTAPALAAARRDGGSREMLQRVTLCLVLFAFTAVEARLAGGAESAGS